jgi:hypothetical protein
VTNRSEENVTEPPRRRRERGRRPGDIVYDDRGEALELQAQIGRGGQGTVWSLTGGQVAVKFIRRDAKVDGRKLAAKLAAVRRYDLTGIPIAQPLSLLADGEVGYTMELLAEMTSIGSLAAAPSERQHEWYQSTGSLGRRLRLLAIAAGALDRLHARGLAYGDVSPGNLLVSARSDHDQVWLIDPDNVSVRANPADGAHATPLYAAPELLAGRSGQDSLTDAFAFAMLAFQVLTLAHPFCGDPVARDVTLEEKAARGELPWIDHPTDPRNRGGGGLSRDLVLTKGLSRLAGDAFGDGLHHPGRRPTLREWHDKLDQAALLMVCCPACGGSYHAAVTLCPWCRQQERPPVLRCDIHGYLPPAALTDNAGAAETGRLRSIILPRRQPQLVRAGSALMCLAKGPSAVPVDPGEPVAELAWDGGSQVMIQRRGRHAVWLVHRTAQRVIPLSAGEVWALNLADAGRWTVDFGGQNEVHRVLTIMVPRTGAS